MKKEFPFEGEFRDWYKKGTTEKEVNTCVSQIKNVLTGVDNIPYFEKEFLTYVPALIAKDKDKNWAVRLLSYVYADGYVDSSLSRKRCSHLQHYFNFCKWKRKWDGAKELDDIEFEEIKAQLKKRIIWIYNDNFYDMYYVNTHKYINSLSKKYISRIDSWERNYFPLGKIKELINDTPYTSKWKKDTIKKIKVLTESKEYSISDIAFFDFRMNNDGKYDVYAITNEKENKKEDKKVLTHVDIVHNKIDMRVKDLGDMTIDHKKSLSNIVKGIKDKNPKLKEIIENLVKNNDYYSGNVSKELKLALRKTLRLVLKETDCELMEKSENARKSDKI